MVTAVRPPVPLSAEGKARSTIQGAPLTADELRKTEAFWQACNYLMLGMIYARQLRRPERARELIERAKAMLTDAAQRRLAEQILAELPA